MCHRLSLMRAITLAALLAIPALAAEEATKAAATEPSPPKVGEKAPDFVLVGEDEKPYRLQHQLGRWVVLAFYPADFTGGCTQQVCSIRDTRKEIGDLNARVFGISVQDVESKKGFSAKHELNFHLLADDERKVSKAYGVLTAPDGVSKRYTFYIDPYGNVRRIDTETNTAEAGKEIVNTLQTLQKEHEPSLTSPDWDRRIKQWQQAVEKDPKDEAAKSELALAYYRKGYATMIHPQLPPRQKYPIALRYYRQALELEPELEAAKEDQQTIVAIYEQMGRPVPDVESG